MVVRALSWVEGQPGWVEMIDQTRLPNESHTLKIQSVEQMRAAIYRLAVRGAPAIGVAAAYGVLLGIQEVRGQDALEVVARAKEACGTLAKARPTAVNLFWALDRMAARAECELGAGKPGDGVREALFQEAFSIVAEDEEQCRRMGAFGAELIADGANVLTHCNAGALATAGIGTALAAIYVAHSQGKRLHVFADETRPLLQGARLTAWELSEEGIDVTVIADGAAASLMRAGSVDLVIVGSDRIARNGDVCNKIGTYGVAVAARHHGIPFYVAAPLSTFDPSLASGAEIPIEQRPDSEVSSCFGYASTPPGASVRNPAFDVTPAELIDAIITESGVLSRPNTVGVEALLRDAGRLP